jgi:hypothetical protein
MKRALITLGAAALLAVSVAAPVAAESDNASAKACVGQDRAAGVHAIGGKTWGDIASDRAGDNSQINRDYRDNCRGN